MKWLPYACAALALTSLGCFDFGATKPGGEPRLDAATTDAASAPKDGAAPLRDAGANASMDASDGDATMPTFDARVEELDGGQEPVGELPSRAGDLIITEVMYDPLAIDDTRAEWFEVFNATDKILRLDGCLLRDDAQDRFTMPSGWIIAPKSYATFARSTMAGFSPTFIVTSGFFLSNIDDEVEINCAGTLIDRMAYNELTGLGTPAGAALSLSVWSLSHIDNDQNESWCPATTALGTDFGSPGVANPPCGDCTVKACVRGSCVSTMGVNRCDCTGTGYRGAYCDQDVDECLENNGGCGDAAFYTCTNNPGAAPACGDVDECSRQTDNCDGDPDACSNTFGGFVCKCPGGYSGNGVGDLGCCLLQASKACSAGDVYWVDSCGALGAKAQECGSANCANGACTSPCPADMARLTGTEVCIDRYENSAWSNANCTGTQYTTLAAISGFPLNVSSAGLTGTVSIAGKTITVVSPSFEIYGCSIAGKVPADRSSFLQAKRICETSGKRICSFQEWGAACEAGGTYAYGNVANDTACNMKEHGTGGVTTTGSFTACAGGEPGVFDMHGNVREWNACVSTFCPTRSGDWFDPSADWTCIAASGAPADASSAGFRCCKDVP